MADQKYLFVVLSACNNASPQLSGVLQATDAEPQFSGILYMERVFKKVFSSSREIALEKNNHCLLDIPELSIREPLNLKRAAYLISDETRLGKTNKKDHFLVLVFEHHDVEAFPELKSRGAADRIIVQAYLHAIKAVPPFHEHASLLDTFRIQNPGILSAMPGAVLDSKAAFVTPFLFAFYYYAHLICWRLEREQIDLKLEIMDVSDASIINQVMRQRLSVIDLKRYFLTNNRSSHDEIKRFCKSRIEEHHLIKKYDRYQSVLELFESYLSSVNALSQERGGKAVRKTLNFLAFIAIPLGLFGVISELSPDKDFFIQPAKTLSNPDIRLWMLVSFVVPAVLVLAGHLWDKHVHKKSFQ